MELHPYSDIDVLILLPARPDEETRSRIESFITFLWDINLMLATACAFDECLDAATARYYDCHQSIGITHAGRQPDQRKTLPKHWTSKTSGLAASSFTPNGKNSAKRHDKNSNTEYNLEPISKTLWRTA
ncbi:MAG: hypothetical protein R3E67_04235 [Pseudomonadales bacterium]